MNGDSWRAVQGRRSAGQKVNRKSHVILRDWCYKKGVVTLSRHGADVKRRTAPEPGASSTLSACRQKRTDLLGPEAPAGTGGPRWDQRPPVPVVSLVSALRPHSQSADERSAASINQYSSSIWSNWESQMLRVKGWQLLRPHGFSEGVPLCILWQEDN